LKLTGATSIGYSICSVVGEAGFNSLVNPNQKTKKVDIHNFLVQYSEIVWRQAGNFACVLGQGT